MKCPVEGQHWRMLTLVWQKEREREGDGWFSNYYFCLLNNTHNTHLSLTDNYILHYMCVSAGSLSCVSYSHIHHMASSTILLNEDNLHLKPLLSAWGSDCWLRLTLWCLELCARPETTEDCSSLDIWLFPLRWTLTTGLQSQQQQPSQPPPPPPHTQLFILLRLLLGPLRSRSQSRYSLYVRGKFSNNTDHQTLNYLHKNRQLRSLL